jgi:Tfp pilus assembly protein PilW
MELVVSMGIGTLALALGLQLYAKTQQAIDRQQVRASRLGSETDLLLLLRRDLRMAAAVGRGSTADHLVLVGTDGSRTQYRSTPEGAVRTAGREAMAVEGVRPRFRYPADRRSGRVVEVSWGEGAARAAVVLHLRNEGKL